MTVKRTLPWSPMAFLALGLLFVYRLAFGLCSEFWYEDERQIYLIGLKFYTTGLWPYFGPDLVLRGFDHVYQLPGALQGLLVGLPLAVLPIPEAPFLLLNLLSFSALGLLAWYTTCRVPDLPRWLAWSLTLTLPWTLHYSTHVVNPSYVLPGSAVFFVGALETLVFLDRPVLPARWASFMMGAALAWVVQLHMSWVLLVPYALLALARQFRDLGRRALGSFGAFLAGLLLTGSLLLPTFIVHGAVGGWGGTGAAVHINPGNARDFFKILGKLLAYASYEVPFFIGNSSRTRLDFLREHPALAPFAVALGVAGGLQALGLVVLWFRRRGMPEGFSRIKHFALATFLLTWVSFFFTVREPWSLTLYITFPVALVYSLYCWAGIIQGPRSRVVAGTVVAVGLVFHAGLAGIHRRERSLYRDRLLVVSAIESKDHRLLGERREGTLY